MAKPPPKDQKPATARPTRLADALRANLKRRKAQARSRADAKTTQQEPKS
jgi:hypothetical protein